MKSIIRASVLLLGITALAGGAIAQSVATTERSGEAEARFDPTQIVFKPGVGKAGLTLSVSGPEGYQLTRDYEPGVSPTFSVTDLVDGLYSYELRFAPALSTAESGGSAEGRTEAPSSREKSNQQAVKRPEEVIVQSGHFRIEAGSLVLKNLVERESETPLSDLELSGQTGLPDKDICYVDDLIVDGSLCVGFDCVCNYGFGFDTIVLKENNLRIFFDDTSNSGSFPKNDWRIIINDSSNGGGEYFGIEDATAGRRVFSIEAGAPTHSLYVDDGGRVGLGTSTPVVDLQVVSGNTPTLRLEQDGSSGFGAQTWDVAGNEANFFIRDATSGSTLPFRIFPGAPSDALTIEGSTGDIGMGTTSPEEELHIEGPAGDTVAVQLENDSSWRIRIQGSGTTNGWLEFRNASTATTIPFRVADGANSNLLLVGAADASTPDADRVSITGELFINGIDNSNPDYVFEPAYELESIEEHARYMWENKHLPAVGRGVNGENGKATINVATRSQGVLEELEKAHIYIEQLHATIQELQIEHHATIADLQNRLEKLEGGPNE